MAILVEIAAQSMPQQAEIGTDHAQRSRDRYKLVTHPDQALTEANILVLTQERAIDREDIQEIDLLVIDEFYKLDPASGEECDRASALNHALYKLSRIAKQIYLLGPNINDIPQGFGA